MENHKKSFHSPTFQGRNRRRRWSSRTPKLPAWWVTSFAMRIRSRPMGYLTKRPRKTLRGARNGSKQGRNPPSSSISLHFPKRLSPFTKPLGRLHGHPPGQDAHLVAAHLPLLRQQLHGRPVHHQLRGLQQLRRHALRRRRRPPRRGAPAPALGLRDRLGQPLGAQRQLQHAGQVLSAVEIEIIWSLCSTRLVDLHDVVKRC